MKKECYKIAPLITGYVDDELEASRVQAVQKHLDECPDCYSSYLGELTLKQFIREKVPVARAPKYLHRRIRRQLLRKGERPSFWELLQTLFEYRPMAASLTVAVIAFLIIFPVYRNIVENTNALPFRSGRQSVASPTVAEVEGKLICLDCEFLSKTGEKFSHDPKLHRSGLKTEDGSVWSFVNTTATTDLMKNPDYLNKRARVIGVLFKNSHYIYVKKFELL